MNRDELLLDLLACLPGLPREEQLRRLSEALRTAQEDGDIMAATFLEGILDGLAGCN